MNIHNEHKETIGERIRRLRKERNLPQSFLADATGVTFGWISQIEQDKANASPELLNKIAVALKVPIRELLQEEDQRMELVSRIKLVEVLLESGQAQEAEYILQGLEDHQGLSESDKIVLQIHYSECRYQQQDYEHSLSLLHPLISSLETANYHDAYLLAWIRNQIGNTYFQQRDFRTALYNYQKALDYTLRIDGEDILTAKICLNLAVLLRILGQTKECITYLDRSHAFFQKHSDPRQLSKVLYERGILSKNAHDYKRAAEYFEQAKTIMLSLNLKHYANMVNHMIASEVTVHQNPHIALQQLHECIERFLEERNYPLVILEYAKIANIYIQMSDLEQADRSLTFASELIQTHSLETTPESAECFRIFAVYYYTRYEYATSIEYAWRSAKTFDRIGLIKDQVEAMKIIVDCHQHLGDFEQALRLERQRTDLLSSLLHEEAHL